VTATPLAWASHLPANELREMLAEIAETADGTRHRTDAETLAALDTVLAAWRTTAEVHADPDLLEALTTPIESHDLIDAPRPEQETN
jgi:hypothetical protein